MGQLRLQFDARRNVVELIDGIVVLDRMSLQEFHETFGLFAARGLLRGE